MTTLSWGAASDTGRVRQGNEDAFLLIEGLFAVADGMGGHRGGAVASKLSLKRLEEEFTQIDPRTTDGLVVAVERANTALVERAGQDPDLRGMGTTLCALALVRDDDRDLLGVVNVGDSRLYLMKEGELEQITEDHSLVAALERQGRLTRAEAAVHPQRNIVTRALGIDERVMVDSWEILPFVGDRYLICSDGLFNEVDDNRIAATLRRLADPGEAARELVRIANEGGGHDNITVVIVDVVDDAGRDPEAPTDGDRIAHAVSGSDRAMAEAAVDGSNGDAAPAGAADRRRSRFTWRVALFGLAFLLIVAAALGTIVYAGRGTYYVGFDHDQVVIFRGRPGGVLWIQPELSETTTLTRDRVPAEYLVDLQKGKNEGSLDEARRYVANLEEQATAATSTTSTTSTTEPPTAPPPAGQPPAQPPL